MTARPVDISHVGSDILVWMTARSVEISHVGSALDMFTGLA